MNATEIIYQSNTFLFFIKRIEEKKRKLSSKNRKPIHTAIRYHSIGMVNLLISKGAVTNPEENIHFLD